MLSILDRGMDRRELLRVGGASMLGLSLPHLLPGQSKTGDPTFGRAKNIIFLYLAGGPPQHETWDPKPSAPVEIRGPFQPISTNIPGIQICELLPRCAAMTDKLAIVRSISTNDNIHSSSGSWVLTGYKYRGRNARTIQPTDWPYFGSMIKRFKPSEKLPPLSTVWIPDFMRLNENVTPAGQTGGFMGREWDPERFVGDPASPDYKVQGFQLADLPPLRLKGRRSLLSQVDEHFDLLNKRPVHTFSNYQRQAFDLITSGVARNAFAISKEPEKVRERYGRNRWGQCVLLARRLIEAGVRLVHVQWPREPGDNAVDNPLWDTHAQNAERMEDVLAPQFDVGFSALIEDLDQRGLLDETLVVAIGEFGRTPKINSKGGRDHWGAVFSFVMAGAGISGGQVFGSSDKIGGHARENRIEPGDLTASLFHLVGLNPEQTFLDREGRQLHLSRGKPIGQLLGINPATNKRMESSGDVARVPAFDESAWLMAPDFQPPVPILQASHASRPRGWRADRLLAKSESGFGVSLKQNQAQLGLHFGSDKQIIPQGAKLILAQEIRSPFAGSFRATTRVKAMAQSDEDWNQILMKHFRCRLILFQFTANDKNALARKEWVSTTFIPQPEYSTAEVKKTFVNPKPGANFSFGRGLGVGIVVERITKGKLELKHQPGFLGIALDSVTIEHDPKPRDEKVRV